MDESGRSGWRRWAEWRPFRLHFRIFLGVVVGLCLVRWFLVDGMWFFWLTFVWGAAVGVHYLVVKSLHVDDGWGDSRAADLRLKSYDLKHVTQVVDSAVDGDPGEDPAAPKRH